MRFLTGLALAALVLALAVWAYQENYRTRAAQDRLDTLRAEIATLQETRAVLRAEWAYLNRPERLRELVELNFERLRLMPMTPEHFGRLDEVAYPRPEPPAALAPPSEAADD